MTHRFSTDLTGDGTVNTEDLLELLRAWGTPEADLDGDGTTSMPDLNLLLSRWGMTNWASVWTKHLIDVKEPFHTVASSIYYEDKTFAGKFEPATHSISRRCKFDEVLIRGPRYCRFEDCEFYPGPGSSAVQFIGAEDCTFIRPRIFGDGSAIGFNAYLNAHRLRIEDPSVSGCAYAGYLQGRDIEWIAGTAYSDFSEHGLRLANVHRANVVATHARRSIKTALTCRRFAHDVALINCTLDGALTLGPDPRDNSPLDWRASNLRAVGCTIKTGGTNTDRPIVVYPTTDDWLVAFCHTIDPENEAKGRGYLRLIEEAQGRTAGPGRVFGNVYNGRLMEGTDGVDGVVRRVQGSL